MAAHFAQFDVVGYTAATELGEPPISAVVAKKQLEMFCVRNVWRLHDPIEDIDHATT